MTPTLQLITTIGFVLWTLHAVYLAGQKKPASQWWIAVLTASLAMTNGTDFLISVMKVAP